MDFVNGTCRDQTFITSLDLMIDQNAFVRVIDVFVDAIDLQSFDFSNATLNKAGRPPFHPAVLLKLYLYGYHNGIRSCRKLEKAAKINLEVLWLLKGLHPHYKTIANFRKDNPKQLRQVFRKFIRLLKSWKLVDGKTIAIDSFKIRAQNSLKNNFNQKKVDRHLQYIDEKIDEYLKQLKESEGVKKKEIKGKIKDQRTKRRRYEEIEQQLKDKQVDQLSTTDPDARGVLLHRNIVNCGYNIQAVSDSKYKMLIGMETGDVNDTHALAPMVEIAQQNLGKKKMDVLADKGYHTGQQLERCEQLGVITYVSPKASAVNKSRRVFPMQDFYYSPKYDDYTCPAGQLLTTSGTIHHRKSKKPKSPTVGFKHYSTKKCKDCPLKQQCTSSPRGRVLRRQLDQASITRNNRRVNRKPDYYRLRQQIIEHQFGSLKRQRGFTHTLLKGKEKVLGEVSLAFISYNLGRAMSILGVKGIIERINRSKISFFYFFTTTATNKSLTTFFVYI